jgi:hypothetical protein
MQIFGTTPDAVAAPMDGATAFFYRYELLGSALLRRKVADTRPYLAEEARLVDVLVTEDEGGRRIRVIRGIVVPERDLAEIGAGGAATSWREFDVAPDVRVAIGRDLGVPPLPQRQLRLVTVDGRRVDAESALAGPHDPV